MDKYEFQVNPRFGLKLISACGGNRIIMGVVTARSYLVTARG